MTCGCRRRPRWWRSRTALYNQGRADISAEEFLPFSDRPVQFCFPYNVAGQPAISLPLAWHSSGLADRRSAGARGRPRSMC